MDAYMRITDSHPAVPSYPVSTTQFQDTSIRKLRKAFGVEGYAVYDYLANEAIRQGAFLISCPSLLRQVARYWELSLSTVREIVDYCLQIGLFNIGLYREYHILTSPELQNRYIQSCMESRCAAEIPHALVLSDGN